MKPSTTKVACPACKKSGDWFATQWRPFCSRRCKLIDLGKWLGGEHVISGPLRPEDLEKYAARQPMDIRTKAGLMTTDSGTPSRREILQAECLCYVQDKLRDNMKWIISILPAVAALSFSALAGPTTNAMNITSTNRIEIADLGGGCFWCMEAVFERLPGVISVTSGFAGGTTPNPTYEQVCTETTGHAEVTQIEFDSAKISYAKLLDVFWQAHDPTTLNRQGADVGTSYRSIILYRNEEQKRIADASKAEAQKNFKNPIVTQIVPLTKFYPAENYHQEYYDKNPTAPYCQIVIAPKLHKLEKEKVIQIAPQTK